MKRLALASFAVTLLLVLGAVVLVTPDLPAPALEARYAAPPSRFQPVAGLRLHLRDEGSGPALLLLHGTGASLHTWDGWAERLQAANRVVRIDLPGFGLTGPAAGGDYSAEATTAVIEGLRLDLKLERWSVAGNSLGGFYAWTYAAAHPDRVAKLILVDAAGFPQPLPGALALATVPVLGSLMRWVTPRGVVEASIRQVYGDPSRINPELIERYYGLQLREGNRVALLDRLRAGRPDLTARLAQVKAPTLILWGDKDAWIPPANAARFAQALAAAGTRAEVVMLPGLGHVPQEEDPAATAALAAAFLAR